MDDLSKKSGNFVLFSLHRIDVLEQMVKASVGNYLVVDYLD